MKYCSHCGKEIADEAVVCIYCGCAVPRLRYQATPAPELRQEKTADKADAALIVLCVIFPIVGLILWALKKEETPKAAGAYGKAALISFCVEIGVTLFIYLVIAAIIGSFMSYI